MVCSSLWHITHKMKVWTHLQSCFTSWCKHGAFCLLSPTSPQTKSPYKGYECKHHSLAVSYDLFPSSPHLVLRLEVGLSGLKGTSSEQSRLAQVSFVSLLRASFPSVLWREVLSSKKLSSWSPVSLHHTSLPNLAESPSEDLRVGHRSPVWS